MVLGVRLSTSAGQFVGCYSMFSGRGVRRVRWQCAGKNDTRGDDHFTVPRREFIALALKECEAKVQMNP